MDQEHINLKSDQIREVFARFGLAIYQAQCLERQLALILATKYGPGPTSAEFDGMLEDLFSRTLGTLVIEIRTVAHLSGDEEKRLQQGLNTRNWLTHRYFWERSIELLSESGRASMIEELQDAADSLHSLDELFTVKTIEWAEHIGVTQQLVDKEVERLVGESEYSRNPEDHG